MTSRLGAGKSITIFYSVLYVDHVISGEEERPKSSLSLFANSKTPVFFCRITGTEIGSRCLSCQTFASIFKLFRRPGIDCASLCSLCWNLRTFYGGWEPVSARQATYRLAEFIPGPLKFKNTSLVGSNDTLLLLGS